jgi:hypothetical protein
MLSGNVIRVQSSAGTGRRIGRKRLRDSGRDCHSDRTAEIGGSSAPEKILIGCVKISPPQYLMTKAVSQIAANAKADEHNDGHHC